MSLDDRLTKTLIVTATRDAARRARHELSRVLGADEIRIEGVAPSS